MFGFILTSSRTNSEAKKETVLERYVATDFV